jgi:hypothetical protein
MEEARDKFQLLKEQTLFFSNQRKDHSEKIKEIYIATRVQSQISLCRIYSEQIGIITEFFGVLQVSPISIFQPMRHIHSLIYYYFHGIIVRNDIVK